MSEGGGCWGKLFLVLLAIVFFPITISYFIIKSETGAKFKLISLAVLWGLVIGVYKFSPAIEKHINTSSNSIVSEDNSKKENKTENTTIPTQNSVGQESTKPSEENNKSDASIEQLNNIPNVDSVLGINYPRPSGNPALSIGSNGEEVKWLQEALNKSMSAGLYVDGDYGNGTASAVTNFQSRCKLNADGVANAATIAMLVDILSGNRKMPEAPVVTSPPVTSPPVMVTEKPVAQSPQNSSSYVLNTNTRKFHYPSCSSVSSMKESNKDYYSGSRDDLVSMGYEPCKRCNP